MQRESWHNFVLFVMLLSGRIIGKDHNHLKFTQLTGIAPMSLMRSHMAPLSFDNPSASFAGYSRRFDRSRGSLRLAIKTMVKDALIMYHSGPPSK